MYKTLLPVLFLALLALSAAPASAAPDGPPYYSTQSFTLPDGRSVEETVIIGPAHPPTGYARTPMGSDAGSPLGTKTLTVPAYEWSFGCSATSGAMIAAYYDRGSYPNLYTGPTNGGVMPMDSSVWGHWRDGAGEDYAQSPLTASRNGLDGRSTRGSIDDYWVAYNSAAQDPYITKGWTQHTFGDAIGDYMRTSESAYSNSDGATAFYTWNDSPNPLTCADMVSNSITRDGTYGRKLFYEARGYTVTDCYNQNTDNNKGGFTFAKYKVEIDAGRPVMINLAGHTVVGVGYDDSGSKVYIHDTWDFNTYSMTWGGSYEGMVMQSVSIVNLACAAAGNVTNLAIAKANSTDVKLTWNAVSGADHYEIWSAVNTPFVTPGTNCASPAPYACQSVTGTSLTTTALGNAANNNTYVARAVSSCGGKSATLSSRVGEFEFALAHP